MKHFLRDLSLAIILLISTYYAASLAAQLLDGLCGRLRSLFCKQTKSPHRLIHLLNQHSVPSKFLKKQINSSRSHHPLKEHRQPNEERRFFMDNKDDGQTSSQLFKNGLFVPMSTVASQHTQLTLNEATISPQNIQNDHPVSQLSLPAYLSPSAPLSRDTSVWRVKQRNSSLATTCSLTIYNNET